MRARASASSNNAHSEWQELPSTPLQAHHAFKGFCSLINHVLLLLRNGTLCIPGKRQKVAKNNTPSAPCVQGPPPPQEPCPAAPPPPCAEHLLLPSCAASGDPRHHPATDGSSDISKGQLRVQIKMPCASLPRSWRGPRHPCQRARQRHGVRKTAIKQQPCAPSSTARSWWPK